MVDQAKNTERHALIVKKYEVGLSVEEQDRLEVLDRYMDTVCPRYSPEEMARTHELMVAAGVYSKRFAPESFKKAKKETLERKLDAEGLTNTELNRLEELSEQIVPRGTSKTE